MNKEDTRPDTETRNTGIKTWPTHTDCTGRRIAVGDTVHILNTGLFTRNRAVVTKLGKARVSLCLTLGRSMNQKGTNIKVINNV